ncbi:MAG: hypothetical protein Q9195_005870 [Heterodermia aff. obscurata]
MSLNDLRATWTTLFKHTLPSLAISKSPVQKHWPVLVILFQQLYSRQLHFMTFATYLGGMCSEDIFCTPCLYPQEGMLTPKSYRHLDHCFARIILDSVIGLDAPWTTKLKAPAWKNMSVEQLTSVITLGRKIAQGELDLAELDNKSLALRGKMKCRGAQETRKRQHDSGELEDKKLHLGDARAKATKAANKKACQSDIRLSMIRKTPTSEPGKQVNLPSPPATPAPIDIELRQLIDSSELSYFRQRVLLALCQVPPGRFTTYAAMSDYLNSGPRAVGNALRNNPFAPRVPCHRVVASGGGIGGFGGEWGAQGKHTPEKVRLLKQEGVHVSKKGERVMGQVWDGFV